MLERVQRKLKFFVTNFHLIINQKTHISAKQLCSVWYNIYDTRQRPLVVFPSTE